MPPEDVSPSHACAEAGHVAGLAKHVLASLQARAAPDAIVPDGVTRMLVTRLLEDAEAFPADAVIAECLSRGVGAADLVDHVIPQAARHLGECWDASDLSFARVTIAAARLQEMLGCLARGEARDQGRASSRAAPGILVVTMRGDHHTLGWKLVTVQLRRQGYPAHAAPDVTPKQAAGLVCDACYDLVLVSASRLEALDDVAEMARCIAVRDAPLPPVVVGGIVAGRVPADTRIPGVVALTTSLNEAISHRRRPTPRPR